MRPANLDSLGFKYAIGDTLLHAGMAHVKPPAPERPDAPAWALSRQISAMTCIRLVVTERIAQECPGGVQLKYGVTAVRGADGHLDGSGVLLEEELIPLPSPAAK